jgi:hypothetical protein
MISFPALLRPSIVYILVPKLRGCRIRDLRSNPSLKNDFSNVLTRRFKSMLGKRFLPITNMYTRTRLNKRRNSASFSRLMAMNKALLAVSALAPNLRINLVRR